MSGLNRIKLAKILAMAGSQHDGERAAAAALADRMVRDAGLTWERVLAGGATAQPASSGYAHSAAWAAGYQAGQAAAAEAKKTEQAVGDQHWAEFKEENPDLAAWIAGEAKRGSEFGKSLMAGVRKFGSLTPKQEAAVRRNIARQGADVW